jgi:hypothetical protein
MIEHFQKLGWTDTLSDQEKNIGIALEASLSHKSKE